MGNQSTSYSKPEILVLQILPKESQFGLMQINGKEAQRKDSLIFIPKSQIPETISCPLNYFQQSSSLTGKWINGDSSEKIMLDGIDNLREVIVTVKIKDEEAILHLPHNYGVRILNYLKLDICHKLNDYKGFDCYAFICLLADVKYSPQNPEFDYEEFDYNKTNPNDGDFIVLTSDDSIPNSIKHWALYLKDGLYLSKFGKSGEGFSCLLDVMDLKGMMTLYECKHTYIARPKDKANAWNGFNQ